MMKMNIKRAQSLAEYAILMSVVIVALVGVHTYVTRGLQAKYKAVTDIAGQSVGIKQYEPYYADTTQTIQQEQDTLYNVMPKGELERYLYSNVGRTDTTITQGVDVNADNAWF